MHVSGTLLNCAQDTGILLKSSEMSGWSKIFCARKWRLYLSKPRCVCTSDMNLLLRASHICFQGTRSGMTNGILFWNQHSTGHTLPICSQNTEEGRQQEKELLCGCSVLLTGSEKAQSHMMVAIALISWLPCTITTTGREIVWEKNKTISYCSSHTFYIHQSLQDFVITEFNANKVNSANYWVIIVNYSVTGVWGMCNFTAIFFGGRQSMMSQAEYPWV